MLYSAMVKKMEKWSRINTRSRINSASVFSRHNGAI